MRRSPNPWRIELREPNLPAAGGADGALERPASNVIDLLFHGSGKGDNLDRRLNEILAGDWCFGQARFGDYRNHALFDLGAAPSLGELRQLAEIDPFQVHTSPGEVDLEDLQAFLIQREVHEEDFVEASLADHLGGKQVNAGGPGSDEKPPGLLPQPDQEERQH